MTTYALTLQLLEGDSAKRVLQAMFKDQKAQRGYAHLLIDAYFEAALWSSTLPPFGECPACGEAGRVLDHWDADNEPVCHACSERESNNEPPAEANYSRADIAKETGRQMEADCLKFFDENYEDIKGELHQAGHDFWLTRNHHGTGFWDRGHPDELGDRLTAAAEKFGDFSLYVGDDGQVYGE